ncbi:MAG TPA: ergothioneine biosynthesis protein EgtB, partial [Kofleriaceae bacterium]
RAADLLTRFAGVRERSLRICAPLSAEDAQVQSMPDASPAKWHLAHTTWFFETFVLARLGEAPLDPGFGFLFNSYYETVGAHVDRARRGQLTRPALQVVHAYRHAIDIRIEDVLEAKPDAKTLALVELGVHHEQQHQELMLTDIKHVLGTQPLRPVYRPDLARPASASIEQSSWVAFDGGVVEIGAIGADEGFAYDCERPRHRVLLAPYKLATRPICNAEVLAFIHDGGYREPRLWLSDGWALARSEDWQAPLYWEAQDGQWLQYALGGVREVDPAETACHLSCYEADAIARWAGARLPTEAEWEHAAAQAEVAGNFADDDCLHPAAARPSEGLRQLYGDVWEWTQSAFAPYPGFRPLTGAIGEYNGKFMANQRVLRGGSCLTPRDHMRASYRNFFPPSARWQMTGVRLAMDGDLS